MFRRAVGIIRPLSSRQHERESFCRAGDAMLMISGTSYEGLPVESVLNDVLHLIRAHHQKYPHGIVLLDDAPALPPTVVSSVLDAYASSSDDALRSLLVIVTTDFGSQGRTSGKTPLEIAALAKAEWQQTFARPADVTNVTESLIRTFPFVTLTVSDAKRVVWDYVATLSCREPLRVASATITADAVAAVIDEWLPASVENGHSLDRLLRDWVDTEVLYAFDEQGVDVRGHLVLSRGANGKRLQCRFASSDGDSEL